MYDSDERDLDLYRAYLEVLKDAGEEAPHISKKRLIEKALNKKPIRFYIKSATAKKIINRMIKEDPDVELDFGDIDE